MYLEFFVMLALIALIIITIVLVSRQSSPAALASRKFALKTHFVNEVEVPAHDTPEAAGLTARSSVTTYTEVPRLNQNVAPVFDQGSLGSCVANALVSSFD